MNQPIEVTYEGGVLRPAGPLPFAEHQRLWITVHEAGDPGGAEAAPTLPDWCNVFAGLSEEELAEVEQVIRLRADLTRDP